MKRRLVLFAVYATIHCVFFPLTPMSCDIKSPKAAAAFSLRVGFGLSLLLVGISHYMTLGMFTGMAADGLGALTIVGTIWSYILPGLMIVGGALFAVGMFYNVAAWLCGVALASIPVGMLLKPVLSGIALPDVMPMANDALIWLLVYVWVVKFCSCCGSKCADTSK